jgi:hypothetical protein
MPIVFNSTSKRGDYNGYFTNSLNHQNNGVYGSTAVNKFLQDAKAGLDCVDIVIAGDSNVAYGSSGWVYGLEKAMIDSGMSPYATCLIPCMHSAQTSVLAGQPLGVSYSILEYPGNASTPWLQAGVGSGSGAEPTVDEVWGNVGDEFKTWSQGLNWAYIASGTGQQANIFTQLSADSALGVTSNLKYRVAYVKFPFGSGQFSLNSYVLTPPDNNIEGTLAVSTAGVNYGIDVATLNVPASAARAGRDLRFTKYAAFFGSQYGVTGPVGFLYESIYRERKGFAVNVIQYYGGRKTSQMATTFNTTEGKVTIKTYLNELRIRQIAAGGTGRVIVFTNTGVNDGTPLINSFDVHANSMMSAFTSAWTSLGYPLSDLAFVVTVTHPGQADDANLAAGRAAAKSRVAFGPSGQVSFVDLNEVAPYSYLSGSGYYPGDGNSHLNFNGYVAVGNRVITRLLK